MQDTQNPQPLCPSIMPASLNNGTVARRPGCLSLLAVLTDACGKSRLPKNFFKFSLQFHFILYRDFLRNYKIKLTGV